MDKSDAGTSPKETKEKGSGMSQAEITIVEEQLSMSFGVFPVDIAGKLSSRFDNIIHEMKVIRSQLAYVETTIPGNTNDVKKQRVEKIADINNKIGKLRKKKQESIGKWHKKVIAYIIKTYGKPVIENGITVAYGDRIEVMKNKRLKKFW